MTADAPARTSHPDVPPTERAASLRERLRRDTRAAHEALDRRFAGMFAEPGLPRYRRFLAMNLAAHRAIEPVLATSPLAGLGWSAGGRLEALEKDAAELGLDSEAAAFPIRSPSRAEAFGMAYVLEGSRLGARFMAKALQPRLDGPRNAMPEAYLLSSSDPAPFRDLLSAMAEAGLSEDEETRSILAADETFRFFGTVLDRVEIGAAACQGVASL